KAGYFGDNISLVNGKLRITRPDGVAWVQDGIVHQDFTVSGFDPYYWDLGRATSSSGSWNFDLFAQYNKFYRTTEAGLGAIDGTLEDGYATYDDVSDSSKGYIVNFQRYEFIHSARYIVFGLRITNNPAHPDLARFRVYEGDDYLAGADLDRYAGYSPIIVDLGAPTYERRSLDFRVGFLKQWKKSNNDVIGFKINRVFLTDFL